jgi:hypothetical protein
MKAALYEEKVHAVDFSRHNCAAMNTPARRRGRPTKYGRPSQPVTLTLPDDVVARLKRVDADLGRAVVWLVERLARSRPIETPAAEIVGWGRQQVIVVTPSPILRRLPGVQLVPAGGGRALIALEHPNSISQLELDIRDAMEEAGLAGADRHALGAVADILRQARHAPGVTLKEHSIIVLESTRRSKR